MVPVQTLEEVRGQPRVVELLERAVRSDRVAQAYLFAGPESSGKYTTGVALAKALNCTTASDAGEPALGCHQCPSCLKIDEGLHPDVITLEREGAKQHIPIATIRKQVIPLLAMPPHEARARVILIDEATALQGPAANALLKTLEEPPARTHFILASSSPDALLTTIRSRCQRINFQALPAELRAEIQGDDEHAGKVRELSESILAAVDQRGLGGILDAANVGNDRALLQDALSQCAHRCHQLAREESERGQLQRANAYGSRARAILDTERAVRLHNAHGQLAIEHMLVQLRGLALPEVRE